MAKWEYSQLSEERFELFWSGPGGEYKKQRKGRNVSLVIWLTQLGQEGWEVVGYARGGYGSTIHVSCLLKRATG
jgi:hypothetical protein